jgi:hypothetical protein
MLKLLGVGHPTTNHIIGICAAKDGNGRGEMGRARAQRPENLLRRA